MTMRYEPDVPAVGNLLPVSRPDVEEPTLWGAIKRAYPIDNTVGALTAQAAALSEAGFDDRSLTWQQVQDYDPFDGDELAGYEQYADQFIDSLSPEHTAAIKLMIDRERENRSYLAGAGWRGLVASIAAGTVDPIMLPALAVPGGGAVRAGGGFLRTAAYTAGGAAVGGAVTETALVELQATRTPTEALFNVAAGTLLAGALGGAIGSLTSGQYARLKHLIDEDMNEKPRYRWTGEKWVPEEPPESTVGAAQMLQTTAEQETPVKTFGLLRVLGFNNPGLRLAKASAVSARRTLQRLVDLPIVWKKNLEGIATPTSTENFIKRWQSMRTNLMIQTKRAYADYKKARVGGQRISYKQFREEIGKSMRRGDKHEIPQVAQMAREFRQNLFDPLKGRAVDLGLLPADVQAKYAETYLTRIYKFDQIRWRFDEFFTLLQDDFTRKGMSPGEAEAAAKEAINTLTKNNNGIAKDWIVGKAGPLKDRTLFVSDEQLEPFLHSDIDMVSRRYVGQMAPEVELRQMFGEKGLDGVLAEIADEYTDLQRKAKSRRAAAKLGAEATRARDDIKALRDILIGTYGYADSTSGLVRAGRAIRDYNFVRLLGSMTVSAIADVGRPVMIHGLRRNAKALHQIASSVQRTKALRAEMERMGVAAEMANNMTVKTRYETGDFATPTTRGEMLMEANTQFFAKATGMSQWNDFWKTWSGALSQDNMLRSALRYGELKPKERARLAKLGIGETEAKAIAREAKHFDQDGPLWLSQTHLWENDYTRRIYEAALQFEVDNTIVTPGAADRPLWMSTEAGKLVGQFKSFQFASLNKTLLPAVQAATMGERQVYTGMMVSLMAGTMVYAIKQWLAGRPISDDPMTVLRESIDRSGLLGILSDYNNMVEKASRGRVGIGPMLGAPPISRYASRNIYGAVFGPTADLIADAVTVSGAAINADWSEGDVYAARKMIPYQNHWLVRKNIIDMFEEQLAEAVVD